MVDRSIEPSVTKLSSHQSMDHMHASGYYETKDMFMSKIKISCTDQSEEELEIAGTVIASINLY